MFRNFKFEKYKSTLKLGLLAQAVLILFYFILYASDLKSGALAILILGPPILTIINLFVFKKKEGDKLKWFDFNVVSFILAAIYALISLTIGVVFDGIDDNKAIGALLALFLFSIIPSVIIGIFLEKGPFLTKMKRLLSIVLFVWALYKLFTSFSNSEDNESKSAGVDNDGDGFADTFDIDGDGVMDTAFMDTNGDGISDMIAKDSDGDGLVDKVFADLNNDGKIDSFVKDIDKDGFTDIGLVDSDGDGLPDKVI